MLNSYRKYLHSILTDDPVFLCIALAFLTLPTGTAPPLISIGLASVIWLFSGRFLKAPSILKKHWVRPVILFFVLPWIGLTYSCNFDLGIDYAMKTKYWFVLLISAGIIMDDSRFFFIIKGFWIGLLMGVILALIQFMGLAAPVKAGFLGFGIVHTLLSMYLIIGILMAAFYFKSAKTLRFKIILLFLMMAFLFHLAVLKGRSGYLIFILMSPLVAKDLMSSYSLKIKFFVSIFLVLSLFLSPVVRNIVSNTVDNLKTYKKAALKGEYIAKMPRFYILSETLKVMKQHPFIGAGTGSLVELTKKKGFESITHPHNNILYMGVSFGIVGIFSCLWLFWKMFIISWQTRETPLGYFVLCTCLVLFLGGMLDTQLLNTGTLLMFSMVYGFLNQLDDGLKKEKD